MSNPEQGGPSPEEMGLMPKDVTAMDSEEELRQEVLKRQMRVAELSASKADPERVVREMEEEQHAQARGDLKEMIGDVKKKLGFGKDKNSA